MSGNRSLEEAYFTRTWVKTEIGNCQTFTVEISVMPMYGPQEWFTLRPETFTIEPEPLWSRP